MSSPTQPITGPAGPATLAEDPANFTPEPEQPLAERSRIIHAGRVQPPEELLAQIARADAVFAELLSGGRTVGFGEDDLGRVLVELRDLEGTRLRSLSLGEAIDLACGERSV